MNPFICPACNYANEPNRVFCQNCGMRLFKREEESADETSRKKKKSKGEDTAIRRHGRTLDKPMSRDELYDRIEGRHQPVTFDSVLFALIRLAIIAALTAVIFQMLRVPDGVPPMVQAFNEAEAKAFEASITAARDRRNAKVFSVSFKDANRFLAQRVDLKPANLIRCLRCYVAPGTAPDKFYFGSEQQMIAMPIYVQILFTLQRDGGTMTVRPEAMSIGRLPMPSFAVPWMARTADTTANTAGATLERLRSANTIKITTDNINVIWAEPAKK